MQANITGKNRQKKQYRYTKVLFDAKQNRKIPNPFAFSVAAMSSVTAGRNCFCSTIFFTIVPVSVVGKYAPPANFKPHFLHWKIPVAKRLTLEKWHSGQS